MKTNTTSLKSILVSLGVIAAATSLVACDKNTERMSKDNAVLKAKCRNGFDLNKTQEDRLNKISQSGLQNDVVVRTSITVTPEGRKIIAIPEKGIADFTNSAEAVMVQKNCDTLNGQYKGVGAETKEIRGKITAVKTNSITIVSVDPATQETVQVTVTSEQTKIDKKSDTKVLQAKMDEDLGLGQIRVEMKMKSRTGISELVALQSFERKKADNNAGNGAGGDDTVNLNIIKVQVSELEKIQAALGDKAPASLNAVIERAKGEGEASVAMSTKVMSELNALVAANNPDASVDSITPIKLSEEILNQEIVIPALSDEELLNSVQVPTLETDETTSTLSDEEAEQMLQMGKIEAAAADQAAPQNN